MPFPSYTAGAAFVDTANGTTKSVEVPAHAAGDRLVLVACWDGNPTMTPPSVGGDSWVQRVDVTTPGTPPTTTARLFVYEIVSRASAQASPANINITLSATERGGAICYAISGSHATEALAVATGSATSNTPDPPSLAPSWNTADTLWGAVCGYNGNQNITSYPTDYSDGTSSRPSTSDGQEAGVGAAWRQLSAASEDPGQFALSANINHAVATIAVRPAESGSGGGEAVTDVTLAVAELTPAATGQYNASLARTPSAAGILSLLVFESAAPPVGDELRTWLFEEGTGTSVASDTADSDDLAIAGTGGAWATDTGFPGHAATGYQFSRAGDGRADTLITGSNLLAGGVQYTLAALATLPTTATDSILAIASQGATAGHGIYLAPRSDGNMWAGHSTADQFQSEIAASFAAVAGDGQPHLWAVTSTDEGGGNATVRLYLDAVLVAEELKPAVLSATTIDRVCVANVYGGGATLGLDTTVFAQWIFGRPLSQPEIAALFIPAANTPPVVTAGPNRTVAEGAIVTVTGTWADAETVQANAVFAWTVTNAGGTGLTTGDLANADTIACTVTAPAVTSQAVIPLQLEGTDEGALSDTATMTLTVNPAGPVVFPDGTLDYTVHLFLGGGWVDLTDIAGVSYVDADAPVQIVRGLQDWAADVDAGTAHFTLLDDDPPAGRWSPENPMAPWYDDLGLNTPVRVKVTRTTGEYWRFAGEISSLGPPEGDPAGKRVIYPVEASGIFRRLGKWTDPVKSVLRREIRRVFDDNELRAYWPCEDPERRRRPAPGLDTHGPMAVAGVRAPDMASYDGFDASAPILTLRDADLNGKVPRYKYVSGAAVWQIGFLLHVGPSGSTNGQTILHVNTSERAAQWEINYLEASNGSLRLRVRNDDGAEILLTGGLQSQINGKDLHVGLRAQRSGSNINWTLHVLVAGSSVGESRSGSIGGNVSLGRATNVRVNFQGGHDDVAVGHIYVLSQVRSFTALSGLLQAYEHEPAGRRIQRLCEQYSIPLRWPGYPNEAVLDDTERMGPQLVGRFVDLLRESAAADGGRLFEPAETVGDEPAVGFRPRATLWSQDPAIEFAYPDQQLSAPLAATPDDQGRINMVTATAPRGEETVELRSGKLSTRKPPQGIGEYPGAISPNVPEGRLRNAAHHHLVRGTVPEARYPLVRVDLKHLAGDSALTHAILSAELGDRMTIDDMPVWTSPDLVSQLIEGIAEETLTPFEHTVVFACSPESPYRGGTWDDPDSRWDADSVLAEDLTTTETSVDITTVGTAWTTDVSGEGQWDWMIGGERVTVTAMTAPVWTDSTAAQTATVVRSVNGITKTHATGAAVSLADPVRWT